MFVIVNSSIKSRLVWRNRDLGVSLIIVHFPIPQEFWCLDVSSDSNEKFGFPEVSGPGLYVYSRAAAGPNARQSLRETKTYDSWISWCMFYQIDFLGCPSFCGVKIFYVNNWKNQNQNVQYPKQSKCKKGSNIVNVNLYL